MPDAIDGAAWRAEAMRLARQVKAARRLARQVGRLLDGVDRDEVTRRAAGRKPWSRALTRPGAFALGMGSYGLSEVMTHDAPWWLWTGWLASFAMIGAGVLARRFLP